MPKSVYTDAYRYLLSLLVEARESNNITQQVLAKRLGKPQSYVSKYESGERRLDLVEFLTIAKSIGINPVFVIDKIMPKIP